MSFDTKITGDRHKYHPLELECPICLNHEVFLYVDTWSEGFGMGEDYGWEGRAECAVCGLNVTYSDSAIDEDKCIEELKKSWKHLLKHRKERRHTALRTEKHPHEYEEN